VVSIYTSYRRLPAPIPTHLHRQTADTDATVNGDFLESVFMFILNGFRDTVVDYCPLLAGESYMMLWIGEIITMRCRPPYKSGKDSTTR
jgi:hypothetical protein